jgi:hypothetical protein
VADNGDVYSFGSGESLNVGLQVQPFSYLDFDLKYLIFLHFLKIDPLV